MYFKSFYTTEKMSHNIYDLTDKNITNLFTLFPVVKYFNLIKLCV